MKNANTISKATKKALLKVYKRDQVSVTGSRGTGYGWINIRVTLDAPATCECPDDGYCEACKEKMAFHNKQIKELIKDVDFYTWTNSMGYEMDCYNYSVNLR